MNIENPRGILLTGQIRENIIQEYKRAESIFVLCDYDGTLRRFEKEASQATPTAEIILTLKAIFKNSRFIFFIVTGRDKQSVSGFFKNETELYKNLGISCGHGKFIKLPGQFDWQTINNESACNDWHDEAKKEMEKFTQLINKSYIEDKGEEGIVWHYRSALDEPANKEKIKEQAKELEKVLISQFQTKDLIIMHDECAIDLRPAGISKGNVLPKIKELNLLPNNAKLLMLGDAQTDEEMFLSLDEEKGHSIKIGDGETRAKYRLLSPNTPDENDPNKPNLDVLNFLQEISALD